MTEPLRTISGLMFLPGAETQQLFSREERREVGWVTIVGTGIPFVLGLALGALADPASLSRAEWQSNLRDHHFLRWVKRSCPFLWFPRYLQT